ncbi:MAG: hypothetical protein GQ570_03940 [Helicobacteraceae bacterium]|nr:hypothetical protein [Helicobacteraceae bacterium]
MAVYSASETILASTGRTIVKDKARTPNLAGNQIHSCFDASIGHKSKMLVLQSGVEYIKDGSPIPNDTGSSSDYRFGIYVYILTAGSWVLDEVRPVKYEVSNTHYNVLRYPSSMCAYGDYLLVSDRAASTYVQLDEGTTHYTFRLQDMGEIYVYKINPTTNTYEVSTDQPVISSPMQAANPVAGVNDDYKDVYEITSNYYSFGTYHTYATDKGETFGQGMYITDNGSLIVSARNNRDTAMSFTAAAYTGEGTSGRLYGFSYLNGVWTQTDYHIFEPNLNGSVQFGGTLEGYGTEVLFNGVLSNQEELESIGNVATIQSYTGTTFSTVGSVAASVLIGTISPYEYQYRDRDWATGGDSSGVTMMIIPTSSLGGGRLGVLRKTDNYTTMQEISAGIYWYHSNMRVWANPNGGDDLMGYSDSSLYTNVYATISATAVTRVKVLEATSYPLHDYNYSSTHAITTDDGLAYSAGNETNHGYDYGHLTIAVHRLDINGDFEVLGDMDGTIGILEDTGTMVDGVLLDSSVLSITQVEPHNVKVSKNGDYLVAYFKAKIAYDDINNTLRVGPTYSDGRNTPRTLGVFKKISGKYELDAMIPMPSNLAEMELGNVSEGYSSGDFIASWFSSGDLDVTDDGEILVGCHGRKVHVDLSVPDSTTIQRGYIAVYAEVFGVWGITRYIDPTDNVAAYGFGQKLTYIQDTDTVIVSGRSTYHVNHDITRVYALTASDNTFLQIISPSDGGVITRIQEHGDSMVLQVPSNGYDALGSNYLASAGAVFVYQWNDQSTNFPIEQKLVSSKRRTSDVFGTDIVVDGDHIIVGNSRYSYDADGAFYLESCGAIETFINSYGVYTPVQILLDTPRVANARYGLIVAGGEGRLITAGVDYLYLAGMFRKSGVFYFPDTIDSIDNPISSGQERIVTLYHVNGAYIIRGLDDTNVGGTDTRYYIVPIDGITQGKNLGALNMFV